MYLNEENVMPKSFKQLHLYIVFILAIASPVAAYFKTVGELKDRIAQEQARADAVFAPKDDVVQMREDVSRIREDVADIKGFLRGKSHR